MPFESDASANTSQT